MNRFRKIFFLITLVIFFVGITLPLFVFAAESWEPCKNSSKDSDPIKFYPQVNIPGTIFNASKDKEGKPIGIPIDCNSIGKMAAGAYKFIAGIAGIAAVIVMMAGGYVWLFAGGNASKVGEAKSLIGSAVLGLFLVLGSYMILNLINPELIKLKSLDNITGIDPIRGVEGVEKICDANEETEILKTASRGCGKINPTKKCVGITCPIKESTYSYDVCLLRANKKGEFVGGDCVYQFPALSDTRQVSVDYIPPNMVVSQKTPNEDNLCGNANYPSYYVTPDVYNDCQKEQGRDKLTSCTLIQQEGQGYPLVITQSGLQKTFTKYNNQWFPMGCRSGVLGGASTTIAPTQYRVFPVSVSCLSMRGQDADFFYCPQEDSGIVGRTHCCKL